MAQDTSLIIYDVQATQNGKHGWNEVFHIAATRLNADYLPSTPYEDGKFVHFDKFLLLSESTILSEKEQSHSGVTSQMHVHGSAAERVLRSFAEFCKAPSAVSPCYSNGMDDARRLVETAFVHETELLFLPEQLRSLSAGLLMGLKLVSGHAVQDGPSFRLLENLDMVHTLPKDIPRASKNVWALCEMMHTLKGYGFDVLNPDPDFGNKKDSVAALRQALAEKPDVRARA